MSTDNNLPSIRHKLNRFPHAVMYNLSPHVDKLPNDVAQFIRIDDEGKLWFRIRPPKHVLFTIEHSFPVHFCFYQKGAGYYAVAEGIANILNTEYNEEQSVTIKLTPSSLQFYEPVEHNAWQTNALEWWNNLIGKVKYHFLKQKKEYGY